MQVPEMLTWPALILAGLLTLGLVIVVSKYFALWLRALVTGARISLGRTAIAREVILRLSMLSENDPFSARESCLNLLRCPHR